MEPVPAEIRQAPESKVVGMSTIRRIPWLTLAIGFTGAVVAALVYRNYNFATGLALGTLLGWFNFRLLRRGVAAIVASAAAPEGGSRPRAPVVAAVFRYGLIGLTLYVIFEYLHVPLVSLAAGLCAAGVATIAASVWAILNPEDRQTAATVRLDTWKNM
jgi:ATP synthase I chain